jgi:hypothetical protein
VPWIAWPVCQLSGVSLRFFPFNESRRGKTAHGPVRGQRRHAMRGYAHTFFGLLPQNSNQTLSKLLSYFNQNPLTKSSNMI